MTHLELREKFLNYFKSKNHEIVSSSSLIPIDDPSLLFTTAGMLQFKPLYAGIKKADYTRAVSIQKCFRLSDLENIGRTARHHTFFEMFGNFCFSSDYFKKEAIEFAWEFSTEIIKLPKEKIYVSIFESDDESFEIWNKHIGIPKEKIVRLGKADNFWGPAGDSGACGPCSELYIDMGEDKSCGKDSCFVGCDCERYLEFWNLVFNEFFQDTDGKQTRLENVGIDTGMGLERLCYITQNVESNYATDVMKPIVDAICEKLNVVYENENKQKINLIADHIRALVFVMSENIVPSNEGRGYVMRRLLRRAIKTANDLGFKDDFLSSITYSVVNTYKSIYPYLETEEKNVNEILYSEEMKFNQTLSLGINKLYSIIDEKKENNDSTITGFEAFTLFDTYGVPFEITVEEASEHNFTVDKFGFEKNMNEQRKRSRGGDKNKKSYFENIEKVNVLYVGEEYGKLEEGIEAKVIAIYKDDKKVDSLNGYGIVITDKTPFYGEMGGQIGDSGFIQLKSGKKIKVIDTQKTDNTTIMIVEAESKISLGDDAILFIDVERRQNTMKNHTATHVLQKVLELTLGSHINQAGSLLNPDYLRFDFTHNKPITEEELKTIENKVNEISCRAMAAIITTMPKEDAIKAGAKALFGEKYGDIVRTLNIGNGFSFELCGGSHLTNTSEIGYFHIVSEGSIASGVRRIEAVTGRKSSYMATETLAKLKLLERSLGLSSIEDIETKIEKLNEEIRKLQKENKSLKMSGTSNKDFLDSYKDINGIKYYYLHFDESPKSVGVYADILKERVKDHIAIITSSFEGSNGIIVQVVGNTLLEKKVSANDILKKIISVANGRGGGKNTFAQGSIENLEKAREYIEKNIEKEIL